MQEFIKQLLTDKALRKHLFLNIGFLLVAIGIVTAIMMFIIKQAIVGVVLLMLVVWILRTIGEEK